MKTILVVDDQPICRELVASALRNSGFEVLSAASGPHALSIIARQSPDLVLLDISMPLLDGLSVLQVLRENPVHSALPVILLTDREDPDLMRQARDLGAQACVRKANFSLDVLLARIAETLEEPCGADCPPTIPLGTATSPRSA